MKKNILIVGGSAKESALAKILSEEFNVYVVSGNDGMKNFATVVDIREGNVFELLNFALETDIYFTIVGSQEAIMNNIANLFSDNGLMIFAPTAEAAEFAINRGVAKKIVL